MQRTSLHVQIVSIYPCPLLKNQSFTRTSEVYSNNAVEPLKEDTPRKGYYHSTMDKTKSPNVIPPINIMRLESLKEDILYTGDKPLEFILVPKCQMFRDSTVYIMLYTCVQDRKTLLKIASEECPTKLTSSTWLTITSCKSRQKIVHSYFQTRNANLICR